MTSLMTSLMTHPNWAGDRRVDEVLAVGRQMSSTLDALLDVDTWQLVASKKELSVNTYLRMAKGGRMEIKVPDAL
jgi:hypothetical protein